MTTTTKGYLYLAIQTIATMVVVELLCNFLVRNYAPTKSITFNYYAIFINIMIVGVTLFSERSSWEIKNGYTQSHSETKTLADHLFLTSCIMVVLFFISFLLSFTGLWKMFIPEQFLYLFRWPALVSGLIQGVITLFNAFPRKIETSEHYKESIGSREDDN